MLNFLLATNVSTITTCTTSGTDHSTDGIIALMTRVLYRHVCIAAWANNPASQRAHFACTNKLTKEKTEGKNIL